MNLRPYQQETVEAVEAGWGQHVRQLVVLPTGGGKTVVFSHLAAREPGRTLIIAHREELIEQAVAKLRAATGIEADVEMADRWAGKTAKVVVASIQTLQRRASRFLAAHFDLVVCDEAHHSIARSWRAVLSQFDGHARVLGVTATPDRGDQRSLGEYYTHLAHEVRLVDLIRQGFLAPITIKSIPIKVDLNAVRSTAGDFRADDVGHAIEPYLGPIAQAIREHAAGRRVLAFLPLIATSQKFVEHCRAVGLSALHVDGYAPDRKTILERFESCEADVLSNAMLLTEGYDDPGIDCVVCLRATKSRALYSQMVGRGTRIWPLKRDLLLLDPLWMHERHSISRPAHLVAAEPDEADAMNDEQQERETTGECDEPIDLLDLQSEVQEQRERSLAKELAKAARKKATLITADEFAARYGNTALEKYQPTMPWESKDLTAEQKKRLVRAKIDLESVRGRGHAEQLVQLIRHNDSVTLASVAQQGLMRRWGHPSPESATLQEFRQWIARRR